MKTTTIFKTTAAILVMFVFMLFAFNACSSDDDDDDSDPYPSVTTSWELAAGDFPSVTISKEGNEPVIGDPIKTITKIHVGNFSPLIKVINGMNWNGEVTRNPTGVYGSEIDTWSETGEIMSNALPAQNLTWHWYTLGILAKTETKTLQSEELDWNDSKRFEIMSQGDWNKDVFSHYQEWDGETWGTVYFSQVRTHPDLYITMERDYKILPENDETYQGGKSYVVHTLNATGVEETQINTIGASLSVEVSATYGYVSGSINATVYAESTHSLTITKFQSVDTEVSWEVPSGEKWRNLTLTKVERYYFSDSQGNEWSSPNLEIEDLGYLENYIGTNPYEIHYKDNNVIYWAVENNEIGIED